MKHVFAVIITACVLLGLAYFILNSESVRKSEYHHCMVTTINHDICQSLK